MFAAFASLAMIFLVLFQQGSDLGGLLIAMIGTCGILFRWTAAPAFVVLTLMWFMVFPFGLPTESFRNAFEIVEGRFRMADVFLVMAVLTYVVSQYRIYGLIYQAVAVEGAIRRKDEPPTRRPTSLVRSTELGVMLAFSAGLVIVGQLIWWFANAVEVVPAEDFPLKLSEPRRSPLQYESREGISSGGSRFYVLLGLLFFGTLIARLVFGYWRLRMMGPAEGGMILLNGGWDETRRERDRLEKWRIWGRKRAEAQAKEAAKIKRTKTGGKP